MSDLVARIVNGETAAEAELIQQYSRGLRFMISRRVGNPEDVQDISQDALTAVISKIRAGDVRKPESLQSFVYGVAQNIIASHYARERVRRSEPLELLREPATTDLSPFERLERAQLVEYVVQMISELRMERDRTLLRRYFVDDVDKQQICSELKVSAIHFDKIKFRAIDRLIDLVNSNGNCCNA